MQKKIKAWLAEGVIVVGFFAFTAFSVWMMIPKSDDEGAERALEAAGYRDIQITGAKVWGCGRDDFYRTGFDATGPTGIATSGIVCGGFLKGNTIRTN